MTVKEFSSEFDVLYNSITSNQAPSLDEYEKSVFLTKAQEELVRAYFNKRLNKIQEGFGDGIYRDAFFYTLIQHAQTRVLGTDSMPIDKEGVSSQGQIQQKLNPYEYQLKLFPLYTGISSKFFPVSSQSVSPSDVLFILQDWVQIVEYNANVEERVKLKRTYPVVPITTAEYQLAQSRAYKYPTKNQVWKLSEYNDPTFYKGEFADSPDFSKSVHLIFGPNKIDNDCFIYHIKYIKNPYPIILSSDLSSIEKGLTIRGKNAYLDETNPCELPEEFHKDVLQRAVELAKAVYQGDINSTISVGQISGTELGVTTNNTREQ